MGLIKTNHKEIFLMNLPIVEQLENGDKIHSYKLTSSLCDEKVKTYCMTTLNECFLKSEMPHPFANELIEFKNTTHFHKDKPVNDVSLPDIFVYKVLHHSKS